MDLDQARRYATNNHHAVLATRIPGGGIQQSPVLVGVDRRGLFTVSSRETAFKTKNLRRDPWVQLCIFPDGFFGDWVLVEGRATVLSLPEAAAVVRELRSVTVRAEQHVRDLLDGFDVVRTDSAAGARPGLHHPAAGAREKTGRGGTPYDLVKARVKASCEE